MLKNIDRCGLYKNFDGTTQFQRKVTNPKTVISKKVGVVKTIASTENSTKKIKEEPSTSVSINKKHKIESAAMNTVGVGINGVTGLALGTSTPYMRILDGIINEDDWTLKRNIYQDIYTYDLAGAVVDLIASLPYSDFNLTGIDDPAIVDGYNKAISGLHLDELMPAITTDYLVNGAFLGSLNWDDVNSRFTALMPHNLNDCEITDIGLFGVEPIIDIDLGEEFSELLAKRGDYRVDRIFEKLPPYLRDAASLGTIQLNPVTTLYVPRRGRSNSNIGNSYFNRILTIHLLEKALIKGSIESAQRRQRAIMHIAAGTEDWEPTTEELNELANYFQAADLDPISGIVVTRDGVNISDVKPGHDFWSWDETFDFAVNAKMRALGVNESILSGDATFNTLEAALSSFIDSISTVRDSLTKQVFTNKLFAITAYKNNYKITKKQTNEILSNVVNPLFGKHIVQAAGNNNNENFDIGDLSQYQIPTVQWNKQLKPKADKDYLDILNQLEEKGIPISLRMFAAAGGENIDDLISNMDDDNDLRLEIAEKKKDLLDDAVKDKTEKFLGLENLEELLPQQNNDLYAKLEAFTKENQGIVDTKHKFRNLANLDEVYGVREYDSNGKRRVLTATRKRQLTDKIHRQIAEAYSSLNER